MKYFLDSHFKVYYYLGAGKNAGLIDTQIGINYLHIKVIKMATKNEMLDCVVGSTDIRFEHKVRDENGDFKVVDSIGFDLDTIPEQLVNGDGYASMKAYGTRAFLMDRSSDSRKYGIPAYMEQMQHVFDTTLKLGLYKAKKASKAGGIDPLLVQAIASLKSIELNAAEVSIRALSKEQRELLSTNAKVKELMVELATDRATAEGVDLDDLMQ